MTITIAFASDHAGFQLKNILLQHARSLGYECLDFGVNSDESVDYPAVVPAVTNEILNGTAKFGVVICGSGIGVDIAANRIPGIRSALCCNGLMAKLSRAHNDANVLALGSRIIGQETAVDCLEQFLNSQFQGGRHERRVAMLG